MADTTEYPVVVCRRAPVPPPLTGRFADPSWAAAEVVTGFRRLRKTADLAPMATQLGTRLRCLWDDECLYVGFECDSPDVWATKTGRDEDLWEEPVCEVFLIPCAPANASASMKRFFEFQLNPLGTIYDAFVADADASDDWRRWSQWDCDDLRTAVRVDGKLNDRAFRDNGWSAQFAIPLAALAAETSVRPQPGVRWRANFCRYDYSAQLAEPELSCIAPTVGVFDDIKRFAWLEFQS